MDLAQRRAIGEAIISPSSTRSPFVQGQRSVGRVLAAAVDVERSSAASMVCQVVCRIWSALAPPTTAPQVVQIEWPSRSR